MVLIPIETGRAIISELINVPGYTSGLANDMDGCAPLKGDVSQWVQIPPGNFASAGSNRSSNGSNEVAEVLDGVQLTGRT